MSYLYDSIALLCDVSSVSIAKMCNEIGISRGNITELKKGRIKSLSAANLQKIADYFEIPVDSLFDRKTLAPERERPTIVSNGGPNELLQEPIDFEFFKKFSLLTVEQKELMLAQIDGILNRRTAK